MDLISKEAGKRSPSVVTNVMVGSGGAGQFKTKKHNVDVARSQAKSCFWFDHESC
jgi:hypothetical protein